VHHSIRLFPFIMKTHEERVVKKNAKAAPLQKGDTP
jgi:hypothetical protein